MPLEQPRPRPTVLRVRTPGRQCAPAKALITLAACLATGCSSLGTGLGHPPSGTPAQGFAHDSILTDDLQLMERLVNGSNSEKAEAYAKAKHEFETAKSPPTEFRFALVLATPGIQDGNPAEAVHLLREVLTNPEGLVPGERSLAQVEVKRIDDYLSLQSKIDKLSPDAARAERLTAQIRHLQAESDERLRELNEAKAKLEAITTIEKSLSERGTRKPNSEGQPQ